MGRHDRTAFVSRLRPALLLLAASLASASADTATSPWSGAAGTTWSDAANWTAGVPSTTLGAVFDSTFANQPELTANATTLGLWVKDGVGQDVTVGSSGARTLTGQAGATLNGLVGIAGNPNLLDGVYLLLDDAGNHNLTFGPGVTLAPPNSSAIFVNNAGTLTIEGQINNPNGQGVALAGTNALGVIRLTGRLGGTGGGSIRVRTAGTVILDAGSPDYTRSFQVDSGICRLNHPDALAKAAVTLNGGTFQLRADDDTTFPFGNSAYVYGSGAVIDVNRLDPLAGTATDKTLRVNGLSPGNGSTFTVTGANGYRLAVDRLIFGNGYPSTTTVNPTTAPATLGDITSVTMMTGSQTVALGGTNTANLVAGVVSNAPTGRYGLNLTKSNTGTWTLLGDNRYTGPTVVSGGRLVAGHGHALGYGGAARINETGWLQVQNGAVLELAGVEVDEAIALSGGASLRNDATGTSARVGNGVAYVWFSNGGGGFVGADAGKPLVLSGGDGTGASALIAALCANSNTVSASGGTGWVTGNTITLTGGGATQNAIYDVTASGGAITALKIKTNNPGPGYGYTSIPTGYTAAKGAGASGPGTDATVTFYDDFSVAAIAMASPGSGYLSAPTVALDDVSGMGLVATAVVSTVSASYHAAGYPLGGDGDLRIDAVITSAGANLTKVGSGVLALGGANTYACNTVVAAGTLAAVNTAGSATGTYPVTVQAGATLAGSGAILSTYLNNGVAVELQEGARLAPHVGTGLDTATLSVTASPNLSAAAVRIAGGCVFEFAVGAGGACDRLNVVGNLTLDEGVNEVRVVKRAGMAAGRYTILDVQGGTLTDNVTAWTVVPDNGWTYSVGTTATTVYLDVRATGTALIIR